MKKSKVILIVISVVCILIGAAMMGGAYYALASDASEKIADARFQKKTHTVTEPFTKLNIRTISSSIEILPSSDGTCRIVCDDNEKLYHDFSVTESPQGTQLNINQRDDWQWYEMLYGLYRVDELKVQVYLPAAEYDLLHADSANGDITIAPDFRCRTVNTYTAGGNTKITDLQTGHLTAHTVSGDLILRGTDAAEDVFLESISGFMQIENLKATNVTTHSSSGGMALENVSSDYLRATSVSGEIRVMGSDFRNTSYFETGSGNMEITASDCGEQSITAISGDVSLQNITGTSLNARNTSGEIIIGDALYSENVLCHTVSGEIQFTGLDSEMLEFLSTSGDVSGNLLSPKNFIVDTNSGYASFPPSDESAGTCHISTVSGNISIAIEP